MVPAAIPAAGIVSNQDKKIRLMTGQWVPPKPFTRPTPAMDPVTVCVVDTGIPYSVATKMMLAALASALQPLKGLRWVMLVPIVCTIRQPPKRVPRLITP